MYTHKCTVSYNNNASMKQLQQKDKKINETDPA